MADELDLELLTEEEIGAFDNFKRLYVQQNPLPEPPSAARLGWQFYFLLITSIASVILAALRTAEQFYRAAALNGNEYLALAEAAMVLLAIEGGIVVYSAIRASSRGDISPTKLGIGIAIMVIISTFAGLGQSLNLISNIDQSLKTYFEYGLSFVIGVGASIVAWIGGEVLGGQIAIMGNKTDRMNENYRQIIQEYNEAMLRSWRASAERKIVRREINEAVPVRTAVQKEVHGGTQIYMTEQAYQYLEQNYSPSDDIPTARQLEAILDIPVSSAQRGRNRWLRERVNGQH